MGIFDKLDVVPSAVLGLIAFAFYWAQNLLQKGLRNSKSDIGGWLLLIPFIMFAMFLVVTAAGTGGAYATGKVYDLLVGKDKQSSSTKLLIYVMCIAILPVMFIMYSMYK